MNGIINNISNPFIVLVNLFEYFKIKKNNFLSSKDLASIVMSLYKGLDRKNSIKFSNSRFKKKLSNFKFSLDYAFGYSTYDSIREFLCQNITNEEIMIPNQLLIHSVMNGIIGRGLGSTVENSMRTLMSLHSKITEKKELFNLSSINDLRFFPILQGICSHIDKYIETITK
jgi:hypothetical protein